VLIVSPSPSVQSALMPLPSRHLLMRHHTLWKFGPPRQTHAIVAYSPSVRLVCRDWPMPTALFTDHGCCESIGSGRIGRKLAVANTTEKAGPLKVLLTGRPQSQTTLS